MSALRWLNLGLSLLSILVPLALAVLVAVRVRRPGRGFAIAGLAVIVLSQLISVLLHNLLPYVGVNLRLVVGVTQTFSTVSLSIGLVLLAIGLIRLTRGTGSSAATSPYQPMPPAPGYPAPPQHPPGQAGWTSPPPGYPPPR